METEGRAFSDLYRNSSEELFLKTMMESPIGMPVPTLEMFGFKSASQNLRTDSEELFKRWLTNGEGQCYNPSSLAHNGRQPQRRPSELSNLSNQQQVAAISKKKSNDRLFTQSIPMAEVLPGNANQFPFRDNADHNELQASDLFLAKAWFLSEQPMTRSRSSELRRRYVAMQTAQATHGMEGFNNAPQYGIHPLKEEHSNGFDYIPTNETPNQIGSFMSPTNSSSSNYNTPQMVDGDKVSSSVSMLRGTLERKKLLGQSEKEAVEDNTNGFYHASEAFDNSRSIERQGSQVHEMARNFQEASILQVKNSMFIQSGEGYADVDLDGFTNPTNQIHSVRPSREQSPSESSAAAPVVSSGFDACDDQSLQTLAASESSYKQARVSRSPENGQIAKDFRERIMDTLKDGKKKRTLERYGSVTSAISVEKVDDTKKRRVERSRKMAEAKERNLTPPVPSDMQAVLKRCETLEKEVRSLKLNLSFMNRKDSEQTKQIEELQKQNEDLIDEKERLLEEIERIWSETGKI